MTLGEALAHIGEPVIYRNVYGQAEQGVITSVGDRFVFVRYPGRAPHGIATHPLDLELLAGCGG